MGRQRPPSSVVLDEGDGLMLEIEPEACAGFAWPSTRMMPRYNVLL